MYIKIKTLNVSIEAPVAQWIERLFPKQKVVGSTPTWRASLTYEYFLPCMGSGNSCFMLKFEFLLKWKYKII
jgi:hypothetical protein